MSGNGTRNIKFAENDRQLCLGSKKSENSRKISVEDKKMTPAPKRRITNKMPLIISIKKKVMLAKIALTLFAILIVTQRIQSEDIFIKSLTEAIP